MRLTGLHNVLMQSVELGDVLEQLFRLLRQLSTAGGLSAAAASALGRLLRDGPMRLTELAVAEAASQPGMTQLVGRLEREGLVRREADHGDRRAVLVAATEAGAAVMGRRRAERTEALHLMLDRLDPEDRAAIEAATPALARLTRT